MPPMTAVLPPPTSAVERSRAADPGPAAAPATDLAPGLARVLSVDELAAALRHHARGRAGLEASVELLIRHGYWLTRDDFRDHIDAGPSLDSAMELMACVDWNLLAAEPLAGPADACDVLTVAGTLARRATAGPWPLSSLDEGGIELVLRAVLHATAGAGAAPMTVRPFAAEAVGAP